MPPKKKVSKKTPKEQSEDQSEDQPEGGIECFFGTESILGKIVENLSPRDKKQFQKKDGEWTYPCWWRGVEFDGEDSDTIIGINWSGMFKDPVQLNFRYLRLFDDLEYFHANGCHLTGEIDFDHFPDSLKELSLVDNQLTGEIILNTLPPKMETLQLVQNQLSGSLDMENLPKTMKEFRLNGNQFSGKLDLRNKGHIMFINLADNNFTDEIYTGDFRKFFPVILHGNPLDRKALIKNCEHKNAKFEKQSDGYETFMVNKSKKIAYVQISKEMEKEMREQTQECYEDDEEELYDFSDSEGDGEDEEDDGLIEWNLSDSEGDEEEDVDEEEEEEEDIPE